MKDRIVNNIYKIHKRSHDTDEIKADRDAGNRYLRDAVYGFILGDALGVPFEFRKRGTFQCTDMVGYGSHDVPEGTWSDDTSMMLATCASIKENGLKINVEDIRRRFLDWLNKADYTATGKVFDVGHATLKALMTGEPQSGEFSNGNGSLMRILPLAFIDCTEEEIRTVSSITHGHRISQDACTIYVSIIRKYLAQIEKGDPGSMADIIREIPKMDAPFDRLHLLDTLTENEIRSSGYVVDTLEAALWCVLQADRERQGDRFRSCLFRAVNLGDDTDTVATVAGGLAGLAFSVDGIPEEWFRKLKNKELIRKCLW